MDQSFSYDLYYLEETREDPGHSLSTVPLVHEYNSNISNHPTSMSNSRHDTVDNVWSSTPSSGDANSNNKCIKNLPGSHQVANQDTFLYSSDATTSAVAEATSTYSNAPWYSETSQPQQALPTSFPHRNSSLALAAANSSVVGAGSHHRQGHPYNNRSRSTNSNMMHEVSSSMHQLSFSTGLAAASSDKDHLADGGVDVNSIAAVSMASGTSQSIPGMVGASSGSTLGGFSGATTGSALAMGNQQPYFGGQQQRFDNRNAGDSRWSSQTPAQLSYPWTAEGFGQQPLYYQQSAVACQYPVQQQQQSSYVPHKELAGSSYSVRSFVSSDSQQQHDMGPPPPGFMGYGNESTTRFSHDAMQPVQWSESHESEHGASSLGTDVDSTSRYGGAKSVPAYHPTASKSTNVQRQGNHERDGKTNSTSSSKYYGTNKNTKDYNRYHKQQPATRSQERVSSLQTALRAQDRSLDQGYLTDVRDDRTYTSSQASSEAIRMLMNPPSSFTTDGSISSSAGSVLAANRLPLEGLTDDRRSLGTRSSLSANAVMATGRPILPAMEDMVFDPAYISGEDHEEDEDEYSHLWGAESSTDGGSGGITIASTQSKKREWLLRMNRRLTEVPVGDLDPSVIPINAIMNAWAKTKSSHGASMVETWLNRAQQEYDAGNTRVVVTNKMYTMAVDAWAKSGEGVSAAQRAETILQHLNQQYQSSGLESLKPTTGIFNAVINAWARSRDKIAPSRAEQILKWMNNLNRSNPSIQPDKYTFNTVIHAYAKAGGAASAKKAQELLNSMQQLYQQGNPLAKPDTITYNVVINSLAKSGGTEAAAEAEALLTKMHQLSSNGDPDVCPNVVTYGAVIDAYAKSGEKGAAAKADAFLANMIRLYQVDPTHNAYLRPNTYVFNTVINAHAKSKEHDSASKAEEMLLAMKKLNSQGMPNLKPDAFTYTAVIDAWAKSGYQGAAARADQLLDEMETKYLAGDVDLKPNTFTYNAVINALAKSGEPGAAARAERVLNNMVNRHKHGEDEDVRATTINFNSVLDAWAKSGGGRKAAERAEEILEWMDRLFKSGNDEVSPDTITFNAVLDAWARSGDRMAAQRAEQILDHMDDLYRAGNQKVKPDVYTFNTVINAHAKAGSAARAEHVLHIMKQRYHDGDADFKPNVRTHTSVIDAWAKSGEKGAAQRAEQILNNMIAAYEASGDADIKPNVHSANAVCNACAFTKRDEDRPEALEIAFRVFNWLSAQPDMEPDAFTYTILLSVCSNLLPREDRALRYSHARSFFVKCCEAGYVNDYVLRKLRQTVSDQEYMSLVDYRSPSGSTVNLPLSWTRKIGKKNIPRGPKPRSGGTSGARGRGGGRWSSYHRLGA